MGLPGRAKRGNNVGFLRLVFASAVIIGHAPEQIDNDRHREPLTALFGTLSLGDVSVDAFFLLSGFLITQSFLRSDSLRDYAAKRTLRIYPAFIVAFLLCVALLAPVIGADISYDPLGTVRQLVTLHEPGPFPNQIVAGRFLPLNGAAWSIAYEARCYVLVALLGVIGALRRRRLVLALAAAVAATFAAVNWRLRALGANSTIEFLIGQPVDTVRLTPIFMAGMCMRLFWAEIEPRLTATAAVLAASVSLVLLFHHPHAAEAGLTIFGGLALFFLAFRMSLGPLQRINDRWDISYGTYLFGWPMAVLVLHFFPNSSPGGLAIAALGLAWLCGAASWLAVEKPAMGMRRRLRPPALATARPPAP